jgi:F0F1-type ATP synthase assembly protein I
MADDLPQRRQTNLYMAISQVGMEMVAPIVVGVILDRALGTSPWIMVGGTLFGFVGGMMHLIALVNRLDRTDPPPKKRNDP